MLRQRVLTALVLAGVFTGILFGAPALVFSVFVAAVCLLAAWEWANLSGYNETRAKVLYVATMLVCGLGAGYVQSQPRFFSAATLLSAAALWWAVALLWVQSYPSSTVLWGPRQMRLLIGFLVILPTWLGFSILRFLPDGQWLVLAVVLLVAAADIGAYFTGRSFGRHKLAPAISPGKSWEGVFGGVAAAMLVSYLLALGLGSGNLLLAVIIAVPTAFVSVLGDLFESMLKRYRGIKDSGYMLPGHGGILDRVDGLAAAVPVFAWAVIISGWQMTGA